MTTLLGGTSPGRSWSITRRRAGRGDSRWGTTWIAIEPLQVVVLAMMPALMDSKKLAWLRWCYNNVLAC